jgi:iron complex transport system substrate-binding protein
VHSIALYEPGTDLWLRLREATLTIAALVNKESEAERQLAALELDLAQMQAAQPADLPPCWWCNSLMSAMCGCLAVAACSRQ